MGLAARKQKQRIGEDPRNTKWAKNESNPGFKILSSMGWSPATTSLGASADSLEPVRSTWKRLPGSVLPIVKSTTSGLGSNPAQASSNSYLLGAPRFVPSSQSTGSVETAVESPHSVENDPDRSTKISIVANGGGFDDLLRRLNQSNQTSNSKTSELKSIEENDSANDSFVLVSVDETSKSINQDHKQHKIRSIIINSKNRLNRPSKRVRILEFCHDSNQDSSLVDQPKLKKLKRNPKVISDPNHLQQDSVVDRDIKSNKNRIGLDTKSFNKNLNKSDSFISNLTHLKKIEQPLNENLNLKIRTTSSSANTSISRPLQISRPINPRVGSRAKYINSKRLACAQNPAAMAEILGIAPI